jgi:hypothetical protein
MEGAIVQGKNVYLGKLIILLYTIYLTTSTLEGNYRNKFSLCIITHL